AYEYPNNCSPIASLCCQSQKIPELPYMWIFWMGVVIPSMDKHKYFDLRRGGINRVANELKGLKRLPLMEIGTLIIEFDEGKKCIADYLLDRAANTVWGTLRPNLVKRHIRSSVKDKDYTKKREKDCGPSTS